jgi:glyceraldehyde 3-phosphate dehydrogenase
VVLAGPSPDAPLCVPGLNAKEKVGARSSVIATGDALCLAALPLLGALHRTFGVEAVGVSLLGPPLEGGRCVDSPAPGAGPSAAGRAVDWRGGRGFGQNVAPAHSGLAAAAAAALPALAGKVGACEWRIPTMGAGALDMTVKLRNAATTQSVLLALERWSARLPGHTVAHLEAAVSSDFTADPAALTLDAALTLQLESGLLKLVGWQHAEVALAHAALELAALGDAADRSIVGAMLRAAEAMRLLPPIAPPTAA